MRGGHHRTAAGVTRGAAVYSRVGAAALAVLALFCLACPCGAEEAPAQPAAGTPAHRIISDLENDTNLGEIVSRYNAVIARERAVVESLRVLQTMIEPQEDGSTKRSEAELVYTATGGMDRREIFSEISNPSGSYTLDSIIGPELPAGEYGLEYAGRDTVGGEEAYRVIVTAIARDSHHFDGELWISSSDFSPVRVTGHVADPPFPVVLITFDKGFEQGPAGLRLLRRHSGEAEVNLLLGVKRGLRHIFYDDYIVRVSGDD